MSKSPIPLKLGRQVAHEAQYRCGYCLSPEAIGVAMEFDHLIPTSRGGRTVRSNLWLACFRCNSAKSHLVSAVDPFTQRKARLFNPRRDKWNAHFRWIESGLRIEGTTSVGRATVVAMKLNHPARVISRRLWISAGWHPPAN